MYSLGIDIGTSGIRAVVMDHQQQLVAQAQSALPDSRPYYSGQNIIGYTQDPKDWWTGFEQVIAQLTRELQLKDLSLGSISHLAIDGTSGTVLLVDSNGTPCSEALMYNDQRAIEQAAKIQMIAPENTAATGTASGLAKLLWLYEHSDCQKSIVYALNQSDWLSGQLMSEYGISDHNNALKMGYDAQQHCWPQWLLNFLETQHFPSDILPKVATPGEVIGTITPQMQQYFGFHPNLQICAGTTDSTAAIIASGARDEGEAITSLGSTLVMKIIAKQPVFNQQSGVYSQPYGDLWLVGGASNSGGAVLKAWFCPGELADYTEVLNSKIAQGQLHMLDLGYYPLLTPGERFPIHNPELEPQLTPRPEQEVDFFQALLEGMADIETMAYKHLLELGAPYPKHIISIGGGAFNQAWRYIREQKSGVPVYLAQQEHAAAGTAILAQSMWNKGSSAHS